MAMHAISGGKHAAQAFTVELPRMRNRYVGKRRAGAPGRHRRRTDWYAFTNNQMAGLLGGAWCVAMGVCMALVS